MAQDPSGPAAATLMPALPSFRNPPVFEVVLGMQFAAPQLGAVHVGGFHGRIKQSYPKVVQVPAIPPSFEVFLPAPAPGGASGSVGIPMPAIAAFPRQWFISEDDEHLVQFQADRLLVNWRKGEGDRPYPRYSEVRHRFTAAFEAFQDFMREDVGAAFVPNQCEVSYLNRIPIEHPSGWGRPGRWVRLWNDDAEETEAVQFSVNRLLKTPNGQPYGRLTISAEGGVTEAGPAIMLNLLVRGRPLGSGPSEVLAFLDNARETIVTRFAAIASDEANRVWEREA